MLTWLMEKPHGKGVIGQRMTSQGCICLLFCFRRALQLMFSENWRTLQEESLSHSVGLSVCLLSGHKKFMPINLNPDNRKWKLRALEGQ